MDSDEISTPSSLCNTETNESVGSMSRQALLPPPLPPPVPSWVHQSQNLPLAVFIQIFFSELTDGSYHAITNPIIRKKSGLQVLFHNIEQFPVIVQVELLSHLTVITRTHMANKMALCEFGTFEKLCILLQSACSSSIQTKLIQLLVALGSHNVSVRELRYLTPPLFCSYFPLKLSTAIDASNPGDISTICKAIT